jgi:hypothetical protein
VVGRHRLGHPDRRVRWPDAGRSSVSDAAYRGIANGMSDDRIRRSDPTQSTSLLVGFDDERDARGW